MEKVILSNGQEVDTSSFGLVSSGYMFISVNMSLGEAAATFSNNTDTITYVPVEGNRRIYRGWSKLAYLVNEGDCVRVSLERSLDIEEVTNG